MKKIILTVALLAILIYVASPRLAQAPTSKTTSTTKTTATVKFAVISDVHSDLTNLTRALKQAKSDGSEFIILTGDLTNVGSLKELSDVKKTLDAAGLPYYAVPGNHDYWTTLKTDQNIFQTVFGQSYQSPTISPTWDKLSIQNYKLILIDNGNTQTGIDQIQWAWIKEVTTGCPQITCLVFLHEPLNHPTSEHIFGEENKTVAGQDLDLIKLLKNAKIKEIFAGHLHHSSHYTVDALTTTIIGSIAQERNWQTPRFLEVTLGNTLEETEVVVK